jgi:hypothetical protein
VDTAGFSVWVVGTRGIYLVREIVGGESDCVLFILRYLLDEGSGICGAAAWGFEERREERFLSAQADTFAGTNVKEKVSACCVRNDGGGLARE